MPKALLVSNTAWSLYNFRRPLVRALQEQGYAVVLASPRDMYADRLQQEGFTWIELAMSRSGTNPVTELATLFRFVRLYKSIAPDVVHHFTIKCVIYGTLAALISGPRAVINAVTGLGHVFIDQTPKAFVLRPLVKALYRLVLRSPRVRVVFQNGDDLKAFEQMHLVETAKTHLIRSSGVDVSRFAPQSQAHATTPTVLFASRLLREKGVYELMAAIAELRREGIAARFVVAGAIDTGNPSSITPSELERWRAEGLAEFPGHVDAIENLISKSDLVVLPSYREGVPRILLEGAAMAKALVATDVPGCREIVESGKTGLLVPAKDPHALAQALKTLIQDPLLRQNYGQAGREKVLREFDDRAVARQTLAVYQELQN